MVTARTIGNFFLKRWPGTAVEAAKATNLASRPTIPDLDADSKFLVREVESSKLRSLARWAFENDGFTREAIGQICRSVFGNTLRPQALTSDEAWNQQAEERFIQRCNLLDASKRFTVIQLLKKWLTAHLVLGDTGIQLSRDPSGAPIVQSVMPHRIGNFGEPEGFGIFNGVRVDDATGAPTHYRILTGTYPAVAVDIPASDFILLYDPDFTDGYRGQCKLGAELLNVLDAKTIQALETRGVGVSLAPTIIDYRADSTDGDLLSGGTRTAASDGTTRDPLTGGMILKRNVGDRVESFQSNRPTPRLPEFLKELRAPVALALGVTDQWVTGSYTSTGPGIRAIIVKNSARIRELQSLAADKILNRLWLWIIADEIDNKRLPENQEFASVKWQWPPSGTIDNGRDSYAARSDLFAGLSTFSDDYGERGQDWRDRIEQKAIEAAFIDEMAKKYGVSADRIAAIGLNPQPATTTEAPADSDDAKTDDGEDDKTKTDK